MATMQMHSMRPGMLGDGAMRVVMAELNKARESAVTQRREIEVTFVGTNRLRVDRVELDGSLTNVTLVGFESGVEYTMPPGVAADTPDAFGRGSATWFGGATVSAIRFNSEGALVDNAGSPINGTVFLAIPDTPRSFRAVTVLGATGRVRSYRWDGRQWTRV
jgi:hypothetical protein